MELYIFKHDVVVCICYGTIAMHDVVVCCWQSVILMCCITSADLTFYFAL